MNDEKPTCGSCEHWQSTDKHSGRCAIISGQTFASDQPFAWIENGTLLTYVGTVRAFSCSEYAPDGSRRNADVG